MASTTRSHRYACSTGSYWDADFGSSARRIRCATALGLADARRWTSTRSSSSEHVSDRGLRAPSYAVTSSRRLRPRRAGRPLSQIFVWARLLLCSAMASFVPLPGLPLSMASSRRPIARSASPSTASSDSSDGVRTPDNEPRTLDLSSVADALAGLSKPKTSPATESPTTPRALALYAPLFLREPHVHRSMVQGRWKTVVATPRGVDRDEWIAINMCVLKMIPLKSCATRMLIRRARYLSSLSADACLKLRLLPQPQHR